MSSVQAEDRFAQTNGIALKLGALRDELRSTIGVVEDPQAKAMLETGAEVLGGLRQAFVDYAEGSEEAWRKER
jgi:hypothetical protein